MGRARQLFTQLDNQLSREAMQRLRSSPQGSVLGALNALFSPHPVTGGPSPSQSASSGLLGRIIQAPGGGLPGGANTSSILLGQNAGGSAGGIARIKLDDSTINDLANAINNGPGSAPSGPDPGTVRAADNVERAALAAERSAASSDDAAKSAEQAARDSSNSSRSLLSRFGGGGGGGGGIGLFGGGGGGGRSNLTGFIGGRAGPFSAGLAGGIGPGILGINARTAGIVGVGGSLLGAVPALLGGLAPLLAAAPGLGLLALGAKNLIGTQNQQGQPATQGPLYNQAQDAKKAFSGILQGAESGLIGPLGSLFRSIPSLLAPIGPALKSAFGAAGQLLQPLVGGLLDLVKQVLPQLAPLIKSAVPFLRPILDGLGQLVANILPGLTTLVRSAGPAVTALFGGLAQIGGDLGKMFTIMAPALASSSILLRAFLDLIGGLLPIVGELASIFARALAPIFTQFAGVIRALLPFLTTIGHVLAALAGAVLSDLVSAFSALAQILVGISPALSAFAKAFSNIFTVLENSGVFAIIGNALEALVKPLTTMINALLHGLTPLLPPIIKFIGQLSAMLATGLAAAIAALLPPLTQLALVVLQAIAQTLPLLLPLFLDLTKILTAVFVRVIQDLAVALSAIIKAIPPAALKDIALGFLAIWAAIKIGGIVSAVSNPVGLITIAVAALVVGIVELVKHWNTVWSTVKSVASDAWHWLYGNVLSPMINWFTVSLPHAFDTALNHVTGWWHDVEGAFSTSWQWVTSNVLDPIGNFFTRTLPGWLDDAIGFLNRDFITPWQDALSGSWNWLVRNVWDPVERFFGTTLPGIFSTAVTDIGRAWSAFGGVIEAPVKWVFQHVLDPLASGFDFITNALGLGKPIHTPLVSGWAAGGRIPGFGGGDILPALLEPGETVVDKHRTQQYAGIFRAMGIKGFAQGGKVGQNPPPINLHTGVSNTVSGDPLGGIIHKAIDIGKMSLAFATGNATAFTNALDALIGKGNGGATAEMAKVVAAIPTTIIKDLVGWLVGHGGGASGSAIADYAMSWLGKVPYVWGGTAVPGGADCSGFVQTIYRHFGIQAPRTSEAQGAWVHRGPPVPGGLAFYHSPPGGPDPGHVAIVRSASQVISQGGGMGPQLIGINALPLLWTGVPPGGLGSSKGGGNTPGHMTAGQIAALWTQMGGPSWAARNMAAIANAESGDDPSIIQKGEPPGLTGWGLYQITPTSGIWQNGAFGNLLNASNNTRAAISLFSKSGYGPWASDPVGRSLSAAPFGYANGGMIREPVIGFGKSGQTYTFAENGPEMVVPVTGGGKPAAIGNVFIQLPEGQTVARALTDLNFWLSVAKQQGWAGGMPGG